MKVRTLIIEDEAPAYRRLSGLLAANHPEIEVVDVIDSIADAVKWLQHHRAPDLILSDIQLSDGRSFEIYKQVAPPCPIIFTTAYDSFMLEAFRTNGIDYLLKPIEEEELARSIAKFTSLAKASGATPLVDLEQLLKALGDRTPRYRDRFLVKLGTKLLPVHAIEVAYFLHTDGATELHTREAKKHVMDQPLDDIETQLDPALFFRLNRQCIARIDAIALVHQHFQGKLKVVLKPTCASEVMVSREKARTFKDWMDGAG